MDKIIDFSWHKVAVIAIMFYYSLCFTTVCLPLMWWYYRIPTTNYYILSVSTLLFGGFIFNIILSKIYPLKAEDLRGGFPRRFIITVFIGMFTFYLISCSAIFIFTDNTVLSIYFLMFLMSGGYFWFCILQGYILAKNDYKDREINNSITWQGKVLVFSIPLSLLLGYLLLP
ncbi:hypothetical protein B5V88_06325 [Heyndrickxia sporothermodurans]|uniref:Uncharacterized protein n=1 Tax=Heyndrickxia sporothermodurans TaxID=46224 RepID=A0AB37HFN3_9BACI|nr:hypothetical protein [Heyndrickxia sporothermodurans]MBL5766566.1 hypothetical protein [Heyndrickxia sporothermodurans]MBL5770005.1 hypothetical protein [Heyndrickxia sporothermodurans]MBL5773682.1 hypothetical protein [Heyndrickxia sporothermodurans]MBL5777332.1 hypothetical protein [Heyndrickxia sporothermodurans]MBL5780764.1 hypothetical protein [Heyndrickxia sporothermodurans]